ALAVLLILIGLALSRSGETARQERGLSKGETHDLDTRTLYSPSLGLAGRPDRLFSDGEATIPEEWKSSLRVHDSHKAQLGVYLILIEEETDVRAPYGVIVLGDGTRVKVENTEKLRAWVLAVAEEIRMTRRDMEREIPVSQPPAKCR